MLVRGKANARSWPKPFYLYIDELADFAGQPVLMQMLQRDRGYGLHMTLANQYPNQLKQPGDTPNRLLDAMKAGCRNKVVFSLSDHDDLKNTAEMLFSDTFDPGAVKNAIHATKVRSYREEMRKSVSRGSARASAYSESDASSESESELNS
jgi:type IV secretory pathway TraG/TraD family ATPase VirD4